MRWTRQATKENMHDNPDVSKVREVEMNEMYHYIEKKVKKYGYGELLLIETKTSLGEVLDIVIPKH